MPAEQKAFEQIEQSEQSEQPEQAPAAPATGEDIDPISLSMTELAELATTPLDASAPASAAPESAPEQVESATGEVSTLSPVPQTPVPAEPASSASSGPLSLVPATPEPQAVDIADLPTSHIPLAAPAPMPEAEPGEALPAQNIHAPLTPVPQTPLPDDSAPTPSSGPLSPIPQTPLPKEVVSASEAKTAPAPLPAPVRESTPRPQAIPPVAPGRAPRRRNTILLAALIIALVLVLGGAGTFLLLRPQAPASTAQCSAQQTSCVNGTPITIVKKPTSLTFSGAVAGPMTIVATPSCQSATSGNLHTLTVNLSGTINDKLYNFGFVIEHYNGPGTYSNATTSLLVLFAAPGDSTTNGWSNSDPTGQRDIFIANGERLQREGKNTLESFAGQISQKRVKEPVEEWHQSSADMKRQLILQFRQQAQSLMEMSDEDAQAQIRRFVTDITRAYFKGPLVELQYALDKENIWREARDRVETPLYRIDIGKTTREFFFVCGRAWDVNKGLRYLPNDARHVRTSDVHDWILLATFFQGGLPETINPDILFPEKGQANPSGTATNHHAIDDPLAVDPGSELPPW
jgi:hypothetical protein